ncbi:MAG: MmcQ/YjbR family DNA-binding protein [Pseudomonadales bacterium]|nr:MmcQ/YjbR family DNA-binding protein [Pseudomonadales bacterium]
MKDPTQAMRVRASEYADVDQGTSCTQSSFKTGGTAFLFVGEQGGRFKAMFKLKASRKEAEALAKKAPKDFQVGSGVWITARFSADKPMPQRLWKKWLDESYELSRKK